MYEPQKAQLAAEVTLEKEEADGTEEEIIIFAKCKMLAVDVQGWTQDQFCDCVVQILSTVHQYASHGSGWRIRRIDKIVLKNVEVCSDQGFIVLATTSRSSETRTLLVLLNIRNYEDDRCFSTASSIIGRTIYRLLFVRCREKRRRKPAFMIIAETHEHTSQLVILCTQWDYRLLHASKF